MYEPYILAWDADRFVVMALSDESPACCCGPSNISGMLVWNLKWLSPLVVIIVKRRRKCADLGWSTGRTEIERMLWYLINRYQ